MTTIILTIIGILLAAAAALMVIFYGGDAFNSGSVGAQANTLQNAGTNVISAVQLYKADGNSGTISVVELQKDPNGTGAYLKEAPALPSTVTAAYSDTQFTATGVDAKVCARVNKNLKNGVLSTVKTQPTDSKMGCYNDNTFYATY